MNSVSKIRIFRVCPAPGYVPKFRATHKLNTKTFDEQIRILQSENLLLPGGFAACMGQLGCEVFDCLYDDIQLQARWAADRGALRVFTGTNPLYEVLQMQVAEFKPDVIFLWAGGFFRLSKDQRAELRQMLNDRVVLTGFWGDELPFGETYAGYFGDLDFVFVTNKGYQRHFEEAGITAHVVGASFDNSIKYNFPTTKSYDCTFCGDTGFAKIDHIRRYELLSEIAARSDIKIFANEPRLRPYDKSLLISTLDFLAMLPSLSLAVLQRLFKVPFIRRFPFWRIVELGRLVKRTGVGAAGYFITSTNPRSNYFERKKPLAKLFHGRVSKGPLETSAYYELLARSKIVLNIHRDEREDYGNIRIFEATGVGSCVLTDRGEELKEFFDVENDIATFTDAEDCVRKIDYLLKHPEERERIAANGQRRTLADHTVMKRCEVMAPIMTRAVLARSTSPARPVFIYATYDTGRYPISYDMAFFVEAAEIMRRKHQAQGTIVNILFPADIVHMPGIPNEADHVIDMFGREFRISHICGQIARLFPDVSVNEIRQRGAYVMPISPDIRLIPFPGSDMPHHTEYYRIVNANPGLVRGFRSTRQAVRYVELWLSTFMQGRRLVTITIRDYAFDTMRNSKLTDWVKFIKSLDPKIYDVVIVPDTDQIATYDGSPLSNYRAFWPAAFDVDLRYALYESAYLNLFVNNGPGTTASLNRNVRYLMFKLLAGGSPRSSEELITWQGFALGSSPRYGTEFQRWIWDEDNFSVIQREFNRMVDEIEASGHGPSGRTTAGQLAHAVPAGNPS